MSISTFTSASLRSLVKLTDKKDSLLAQISKIESELSSFLIGKPALVKKGKGRPAKKVSAVKKAPKEKKAAKAPKANKKVVKSAPSKRGPRGGLGKKIVSALEAAGDEGVKVVDLAKKLKAKAGNLHVWFATTAKKNLAIKKVGKGHYKLEKK